MRVAVPGDGNTNDPRVPMVPSDVAKLVKLGADVCVEAGLGQSIGFADEAYKEAGAAIVADRSALLGEADMVLRLNKPSADDIALLILFRLGFEHTTNRFANNNTI